MKTYKEFITELNKVELAMRAGKLGLKSIKKLGIIFFSFEFSTKYSVIPFVVFLETILSRSNS